MPMRCENKLNTRTATVPLFHCLPRHWTVYFAKWLY